MRLRKRAIRGFSLVELVVVIVIIGVIAAIAIPRVSRGARGADEAALAADLETLRNAIDFYAAEHGGSYPGNRADGVSGAARSAVAFVNQLTRYSDAQGKVSPTKDPTRGIIYGPYLRKGMPPLPLGKNKGSTTVAIDATHSPPLVTNGGAGWVYNPITGEIIANSDDKSEEATLTYDQY